jgi:hypothetical protein
LQRSEPHCPCYVEVLEFVCYFAIGPLFNLLNS